MDSKNRAVMWEIKSILQILCFMSDLSLMKLSDGGTLSDVETLPNV
jgi:hypothetical protein